MNRHKWERVITYGMKAACAGIIAMVPLSATTIFYKNTGVHIVTESGATDYAWFPEQKMSTMTEGYSWIRMDENGYNNSYIQKIV